MIQLAYCSIARPLFTDSDIMTILEVSRSRNREHAITGVLLYQTGYVVQVLEGKAERVQQLYRNIQKDPRHTNVSCVYEDEIREREFTNWTMGFHYAEFGYAAPPQSFSTLLLENVTDNFAPRKRGTALLHRFATGTREEPS